MEIEILGFGGGLGEPTTSIRVGDEVLLDAGSGLENVASETLRKIRRVYLTHAHADHISALPLLIENLFETAGKEPVEVFGLPEVLTALRSFLFNGSIWPDFEKIPSEENGFLRLREVGTGEGVEDPSGISVLPFATDHEVPSCGYAIRFPSGKQCAVTGDTGYRDEVVEAIDQLGALDLLVTECSYPNDNADKAERFRHLTPSLVRRIVHGLRVQPKEVWVGHFKPRLRETIKAELKDSGFVIPGAGYVKSF